MPAMRLHLLLLRQPPELPPHPPHALYVPAYNRVVIVIIRDNAAMVVELLDSLERFIARML